MYTNIEKFVSEAECKDLIAFAENECERSEATYITNHHLVNGEFTPDNHMDEKVHKATHFQIPPDHPILDRLWAVGTQFADQQQIEINTMSYPSILKYEEGCHFAWHTDGFNKTDKLTLGVQLSGPDDYIGAEFQFGKDTAGETQTSSEDIYKDWELTQKSLSPIHTWPKDRGTMIIYDSFLYHRVTPVTKGTRYVLLSWFRLYED